MKTAEFDRAAAQGAVTPDKFLTHWKDIRDAQHELDDVAPGVARAKKAAKRDGIDLDALRFLQKLRNMDLEDAQRHMNIIATYAQWLDMPVFAAALGIKATPPKTASQDEYELWQCGEAGFAAGKTGTPRADNPYANQSPAWKAWNRKWPFGFRLAQGKIAKEMAKGTAVATLPPRRPAKVEEERPGATH